MNSPFCLIEKPPNKVAFFMIIFESYLIHETKNMKLLLA